MSRIRYDLCVRDTHLTLGRETRIMGIINCTPDSFSGDGKVFLGKDSSACLRLARKFIRDGADILDIGGESTRPGARRVALSEEIRRVIPVIEKLAGRVSVPLSVDTSKPEVARRALDAGASIVNNIRGTALNRGFLKMIRDYKAGLVIMHMRGTPASMHRYAHYKDIVREVIEELKISVEKCLEIGIKKDRIIVDPGIGFAKSLGQNLTLIRDLGRLNVLCCPILLGTSRKSFIGQVLQNEAGDRLMGTAVTLTAGVMQGAHIVRVHDVGAIKETMRMSDAILNADTR